MEIDEEIEEDVVEIEEEDDRTFIISRIRMHRRNAIIRVISGLFLTIVVAFIPLTMWFTETPAYPAIFSHDWWLQNELGSVILGTIIVLLISTLPLLPIIWGYRYIRADIIDNRRLKKILADNYGMSPS